MYVDVFKQKSFVACVCRGGPAGVTAPAWPCVGERKQRICLNNVKKERKETGEAGASESAARELPQGRRKALHQQTHEGERRETGRGEGNKTGLLAIKDVLLLYFLSSTK